MSGAQGVRPKATLVRSGSASFTPFSETEFERAPSAVLK